MPSPFVLEVRVTTQETDITDISGTTRPRNNGWRHAPSFSRGHVALYRQIVLRRGARESCCAVCWALC
jgi:hypothetical protein